MAALLRLTSDDRALHFLKLDVSDKESISGAVKALKHETGRLDVLINNAGIILKGSDGILTVSREKLEQIIRVNAVSPGWVRTDMGGSAAPRYSRKRSRNTRLDGC